MKCPRCRGTGRGDTDPWVGPPAEDEWWWTVEAQTSTMEVLARWMAVGPHRAGAKRDFLTSLGPEIEVVAWGRTEPVDTEGRVTGKESEEGYER